jgi:hypothetical protein
MSEIIGGAWWGFAPLLLSLAFMMIGQPLLALHASSRAGETSDVETSSDACLSQVRMEVSVVTLQLVDRVRLPAETRAEMIRETTEIWRAAGIDVIWSKLPAAGTAQEPVMDPSNPHVTVIVTHDIPEALASAPAAVRVMASILFIENRPTKLIAAYPAEVQRLLDTVRLDVRAVSERPAALRNRLMGRVLGRAIAHELGHFLFGSSGHTADGLMRARHRLDDLTSPFRRAFRVVPTRPFACE